MDPLLVMRDPWLNEPLCREMEEGGATVHPSSPSLVLLVNHLVPRGTCDLLRLIATLLLATYVRR